MSRRPAPFLFPSCLTRGEDSNSELPSLRTQTPCQVVHSCGPNNLWSQNILESQGVRPMCRRSLFETTFASRVLSPQPGSPVSECRHSGSAMIMAGPADTNDKAGSRRFGAPLPAWRTRWATSRMHALVLRLNRRLGPLRGCRFFNALQIRGQGRALQVFFLWAFGVDRR